MELLLDMCKECRRLSSSAVSPKKKKPSSSYTNKSSTPSSYSSSSYTSSFSSYSYSYSSSSSSPRSRRNVFIGVFYIIMLIDVSTSAIDCYRDADCRWNECCAGYYKNWRAHTKCRPKLYRNNVCYPITKMRYIALPGGFGVFDQCGCRNELTCKRIERKNWTKKKRIWSRKKQRRKTQYKYRCKYIPAEPREVGEWYYKR